MDGGCTDLNLETLLVHLGFASLALCKSVVRRVNPIHKGNSHVLLILGYQLLYRKQQRLVDYSSGEAFPLGSAARSSRPDNQVSSNSKSETYV